MFIASTFSLTFNFDVVLHKHKKKTSFLESNDFSGFEKSHLFKSTSKNNSKIQQRNNKHKNKNCNNRSDWKKQKKNQNAAHNITDILLAAGTKVMLKSLKIQPKLNELSVHGSVYCSKTNKE